MLGLRKILPRKKSLRPRYGVNPHELRDLFRSEWELSPARNVCAEFFMGHTIDPLEYNKIMQLHPDWAEEQYRRAEPWLNILSEDPRVMPVTQVARLEEQLQHERRVAEEYARELQRVKEEALILNKDEKDFITSFGKLLGDREVLRKFTKFLEEL